MKFFKILVNTFKYEESQNNINYNIIQNLKNFDEVFGLNKHEQHKNLLHLEQKK